MSPDHVPPSFAPGALSPSSDAVRQEDALFRALLYRVQTSSDKANLLERGDAALRLILNRDDDQRLREDLTAQINRLIVALPDDVSVGPGRMALGKAVEACLAILRTAEQRRVIAIASPDIKPGTPVASAASYEQRAKYAGHRHHFPEEKPSPWRVPGLIAVLLLILAGGLAIGLHERGAADQQVRPLIAQMEAAARGNAPPTNIFGGALKVAVQGGRTVVTVEGVPAGECVSSGWDLVRKGLLTVNGVTPNRVSAAILNELCHTEEKATLAWAPKPAAE
ncbi:MAG TPA: hypothetical protein VN809_10030 [Telmatospirillum sp.]|nr:hypothetical protein [Telmatospirillum sp.]